MRALCEGKIEDALTGEVNVMDLARYVVRGGFPSAVDLPAANSQLIAKSYVETILNDDARRIDGKSYDIHKMRLLLASLARNECTTASKSKLIGDIAGFENDSVDPETATTYLDVFDRFFLFDNQKPFSPSLRSSIRVKQAEKRYFCDPSLPCALLGATPEKLINDLETFGFLFESLCERDLAVYCESFGGKLFHYQDYKGREIDAVIELSDASWCAFEIKLGGHQIEKAAQGLIAIRDSIVAQGGKAPSVLCVVCGMSNAAYRRFDGVYVVPITSLKN